MFILVLHSFSAPKVWQRFVVYHSQVPLLTERSLMSLEAKQGHTVTFPQSHWQLPPTSFSVLCEQGAPFPAVTKLLEKRFS